VNRLRPIFIEHLAGRSKPGTLTGTTRRAPPAAFSSPVACETNVEPAWPTVVMKTLVLDEVAATVAASRSSSAMRRQNLKPAQ